MNVFFSLHRTGVFVCSLVIIASCYRGSSAGQTTFCNPLNISYNFQTGYREAADPLIVLYKNDYFLFASHSAGYWHSADLLNWKFVPIAEPMLPIDAYAPGAFVVGDTLYFIASNSGMYRSTDPKNGTWSKATSWITGTDPALFLDDDGSSYLYWGCSNSQPTYGVRLDTKSFFAHIPPRFNGVAFADTRAHGWERPGHNHELTQPPWVEGCWMTKYKSTYYLQYAAPGTEYDSYADGVYTSASPSGPFTYQSYNPVCYKPRGFISGAGHGCTFRDKHGNYWRIVTMTVSVLHQFERRIGLFPAGFDADGMLFTNTVLGDYPVKLASGKFDPNKESSPGWMLLSRRKKMSASSTLPPYSANNACNENVKDYWSASTRNPGEWLMMDLGVPCTLYSIQTNFAEHASGIKGRPQDLYQQYTIEISTDSSSWNTIVDKNGNTSDVPHDYIELPAPRSARFIKLTNKYTPGKGTFSVRDLRVFGKAPGSIPATPSGLIVERNKTDSCVAAVTWNSVSGADGYIVRYGIQPDKLYLHYLLYDSTSITIRALNKNVPYYFSVEAFNACGRSDGPVMTVSSIKTSVGAQKKSAGLRFSGVGGRDFRKTCAANNEKLFFRIDGKALRPKAGRGTSGRPRLHDLPAGAYVIEE